MDFERFLQTRGKNWPHAFVLQGSGDLLPAALKLAAEITGEAHRRKVLAGIHPDITLVSPPEDGRMIKVDAIRQMRGEMYVLPNEADMRVCILLDAHTMNPNAANALLKILEEPPRHAAFILATPNPGMLPETVLSRCVRLTLPTQEVAPSKEAAAAADALALVLAEKDELKLYTFLSTLEKNDRYGIREFCAQAAARMAEAVSVSCGLKPGSPAAALAGAFGQASLAAMGTLLSETASNEANLNSGILVGYLCVSLWQLAV